MSHRRNTQPNTPKNAVFSGNIMAIRAIEDSIRATRKYTEGIGTMRLKHPVQGESFPSRKFIKYYEVYPDVEVSWDMPVDTAIDWLWGETERIDVIFDYDYRSNHAEVKIRGGYHNVQSLIKSIPGFGEAIAAVEDITAARAEEATRNTCAARSTEQDRRPAAEGQTQTRVVH